MEFSNQALFTIAVVVVAMASLVLQRFSTDLVLMGALTLLLISGVLSLAQMLGIRPGRARSAVCCHMGRHRKR